MNHRQILAAAINELTAAGIEEASNDARILFEQAFSMSRTEYLVHAMEEADAGCTEAFDALIKQRALRKPLQYITGKAYFMGLEFNVDSRVLIPRFDTEILVEEALKYIKPGDEILDMCTGSGCIGISLGVLGKNCRVDCADISRDALYVARSNIALNAAENVTLIESDMFSDIDKKYDQIVSNPPYIKSSTVDTLMPEVLQYEPRLALDGTKDGLFFYRILAEKGPDFLKNGGLLMMEIGYDQAGDVVSLLQKNHFTDIKVIRDLAGLDRVVCGRRI
ncbi:MAG: peptide chain release factor N(5)-glutamine methyltransferase [Butyrivibrio sp.]